MIKESEIKRIIDQYTKLSKELADMGNLATMGQSLGIMDVLMELHKLLEKK